MSYHPVLPVAQSYSSRFVCSGWVTVSQWPRPNSLTHNAWNLWTSGKFARLCSLGTALCGHCVRARVACLAKSINGCCLLDTQNKIWSIGKSRSCLQSLPLLQHNAGCAKIGIGAWMKRAAVASFLLCSASGSFHCGSSTWQPSPTVVSRIPLNEGSFFFIGGSISISKTQHGLCDYARKQDRFQVMHFHVPVFSHVVILCGWLGAKHQLTNCSSRYVIVPSIYTTVEKRGILARLSTITPPDTRRSDRRRHMAALQADVGANSCRLHRWRQCFIDRHEGRFLLG